ncbi:MAG TPA: S26 family signal peptidase [Isosphaeraceae bacterium]|nr:S26 family signal peptidase [Isosphaeraceae bacterium]
MRRTYATRHDVRGSAPDRVRASQADANKPEQREGYRETVEAIVVAMILALLVRGFEAEAFVIPTGSMAPTLMGRHKEITCPQCGYVYAVNASDEVESSSVGDSNGSKVLAGTCVNCRFQARLDKAPSFKGDRILVMKFPYDMPHLPGSSNPERWDVVVFRYPEKPEVSYIKRLVGLPGEVLKIYFGDIYSKPPGAKDFHLERKPLRHQRAMQMMVYDDTHRPVALRGRPEWRRWTSRGDWNEATPGRFSGAGETAPDWAELRYRHLVPDPEQWRAIVDGLPLPYPPRPTLITDFSSYNTGLTDNPHGDPEGPWMQPNWVGDLTLSAELNVKAPGGAVRFELIEGGVANRCDIDLATGVATLSHGGKSLGEKPSGISGPGSYSVEFANVDDRLTLVVNGGTPFGDGLPYDVAEPHPAPTAADLSPAAIAARGAAIDVSDLVLKRDIYYTQHPGRSDYRQSWEMHSPRMPVELSDPAQFAALGELESREYPIAPNRFLMLGDNSPRSADSRGWSTNDLWDPSNRASWEVPRALITGKAFFVYWPHGKLFGPNFRIWGDLRFPFRPYLERMKWIR